MNIFKRFGLWYKKTFDKVFRKLAPHAAVAVKITEGIKKFLDSPAGDILVIAIPGDVDDKLRDKLRHEILPKVILHLAHVYGVIQASEGDPATAAERLRDYINSLNGNLKVDAYIRIAATFTAALADGIFTWNELVSVSQAIHKAMYEAKVFNLEQELKNAA